MRTDYQSNFRERPTARSQEPAAGPADDSAIGIKMNDDYDYESGVCV